MTTIDSRQRDNPQLTEAAKFIWPSNPAALRPNVLKKGAIFGCPICGRMRFNPYEILFENAVVITSGQPATCGLCGDGCFR